MRILDQISALVAVADGGEGVGGAGSMGSWGSGRGGKNIGRANEIVNHLF